MHASMMLCLMFVGGPVAPGPDVDIISVPLKDDLTATERNAGIGVEDANSERL